MNLTDAQKTVIRQLSPNFHTFIKPQEFNAKLPSPEGVIEIEANHNTIKVLLRKGLIEEDYRVYSKGDDGRKIERPCYALTRKGSRVKDIVMGRV